jgi:hypothetical protein
MQRVNTGIIRASPTDIQPRSEGVRMPIGKVRKIQKVTGVGSLAKFLAVSYRQLGEKLAKLVGHTYGKGAIGTWAMAETAHRSRKWFKQYWMPHDVEQAFYKLIRDFVHWATSGRWAASVKRRRGTHLWQIKLVKVAR